MKKIGIGCSVLLACLAGNAHANLYSCQGEDGSRIQMSKKSGKLHLTVQTDDGVLYHCSLISKHVNRSCGEGEALTPEGACHPVPFDAIVEHAR